jgi:hypothetical protein
MPSVFVTPFVMLKMVSFTRLMSFLLLLSQKTEVKEKAILPHLLPVLLSFMGGTGSSFRANNRLPKAPMKQSNSGAVAGDLKSKAWMFHG